LVNGQAQEEDDVPYIPPLDEEGILIYMLHEVNGGNEDPLNFAFNLKYLN